MHTIRNYILALSIGSLISIMVVYNTLLGQKTSMSLSFLINHLIGIVTLTLLLIILRVKNSNASVKTKAPWYLYFGGAFGFLILNANYITITTIGASLSMATAVFGQSIGSLLFDLGGFMGMPTYKISKHKIAALCICFLGIIVMTLQGENFAPLYVGIGIATGVITIIQMVYNGRLASYKGILFSARNNVLSGFIIALIIYSFTSSKELSLAFKELPKVPFHIIIGGGTIAIFVVTGANYVINRIPTLYSALLLSSAQIMTSIFLDYFLLKIFSWALLVGSFIVLIGMVMNVWVDSKERY
jgi:transporter family-2 protein